MHVQTISAGTGEFSFDAISGALISIRETVTGTECLNGDKGRPGPFAVFHDFERQFAIERSRPGSMPTVCADPETICRRAFDPRSNPKVSFDRRAEGDAETLTVRYEDDVTRLRATLSVSVRDNEDSSTWALTITNGGSDQMQLLPVFPLFGGVRLGEGLDDLMVANDQAGYICPLWSKPGGIYGNGGQMSMQWGCVFSHDAECAFGFIVEDPDLTNKEIRYADPRIEVRYFPPVDLDPGESIALPHVRVLVYRGDWKPTAQAYRRWFPAVMPPLQRPEWLDSVDAYRGVWAEKRGNPFEFTSSIAVPMDSFDELDRSYLRDPLDFLEYAFYCRQSMGARWIRGRWHRTHTDGANIVREDLGGAEAFARGVERVHRLGYRVGLYVEGFIVPEDSEIGDRAREWVVEHADGNRDGGYSQQGFMHMCPGCVEWQDHVAEMCTRLIRETGADGIRLDSLGYYFFPCYNPSHNHRSPFDHNVWIRELLSKTWAAMKAVNPDCVLATEAPVDFFSSSCHTGYSSLGFSPDWNVSTADIAPMRVAIPDYYLFLIGSGPVAASLLGYPGGNVAFYDGHELTDLEESWRSTYYAVSETVRWGEPGKVNPEADRDDVECRLFHGSSSDVVVGARASILVDPDEYIQRREHQPRFVGGYRNGEVRIKRGKVGYEVAIPNGGRTPTSALVYDVEHLSLRTAEIQTGEDRVRIRVDANWFVLVLSYDTPTPGILIADPGELQPGERLDLHIALVGNSGPHKAAVTTPLLNTGTAEVSAPGSLAIDIPDSVAQGKYWIRAEGKGLLPFKRLVTVGQVPQPTVVHVRGKV